MCGLLLSVNPAAEPILVKLSPMLVVLDTIPTSVAAIKRDACVMSTDCMTYPARKRLNATCIKSTTA